MHLICCLFFCEAWFDFCLVSYLTSMQNDLADDLSCHCLSSSSPSFNLQTQSTDTRSTPHVAAGGGVLGLTSLDSYVHFYCRKGVVDSTHGSLNQV